jgi:hypothetical protein
MTILLTTKNANETKKMKGATAFLHRSWWTARVSPTTITFFFRVLRVFRGSLSIISNFPARDLHRCPARWKGLRAKGGNATWTPSQRRSDRGADDFKT